MFDEKTNDRQPATHLEAVPKVSIQNKGDTEDITTTFHIKHSESKTGDIENTGGITTKTTVLSNHDEDLAKPRKTEKRKSKEVGSPYFSVNWERLKELLEEDTKDEWTEISKVSGERRRGGTGNKLFEEKSKEEASRTHLKARPNFSELKHRGDMESTNITATAVTKRDKNPAIQQTQTGRSTQVGSPYFSVNWGRLQELLDQSREENFAVNHIEHNPKQNAVQRKDDEMNKKRMSKEDTLLKSSIKHKQEFKPVQNTEKGVLKEEIGYKVSNSREHKAHESNPGRRSLPTNILAPLVEVSQ